MAVRDPTHQEPEPQSIRLAGGEGQRRVPLEHRLVDGPEHLHLKPVVHDRQRPHPDLLSRPHQRRERRGNALGRPRPGEAHHMKVQFHPILLVVRVLVEEGSGLVSAACGNRRAARRVGSARDEPGHARAPGAPRRPGAGSLHFGRLSAADPGRTRTACPAARRVGSTPSRDEAAPWPCCSSASHDCLAVFFGALSSGTTLVSLPHPGRGMDGSEYLAQIDRMCRLTGAASSSATAALVEPPLGRRSPRPPVRRLGVGRVRLPTRTPRAASCSSRRAAPASREASPSPSTPLTPTCAPCTAGSRRVTEPSCAAGSPSPTTWGSSVWPSTPSAR